MSMPNTKKPPGASEKKRMGWLERTGSFAPKKEPAPRISRMEPMQSRAVVKPTPIASPSSAESAGACLLAYISALPKIMQLTTISGR